MVLGFPLNEPLSAEELVNKIRNFVSKHVQNQQQAENLMLVISIQNIVEEQKTKNLN